jgi:hypothetical protein
LRSPIRYPCRCSSSAKLRVLLQVQRKGDSGSPRMTGSTSSSKAANRSGLWSIRALRPPPDFRIRPAGTDSCCPSNISRRPAWIVVRERPVALATNDIPPNPSELASAAAHTLRPRSSSTTLILLNFSRIAVSSAPHGGRVQYFSYLFKLFMRTFLVL